MRTWMAVIAGLALCALPRVGAAMYIEPDVARVPVERIISNLEARLRAEKKAGPDQVALRIALARVHAMAYARRTKVLLVQSPVKLVLASPDAKLGEVRPRELAGQLKALGSEPFSACLKPGAGKAVGTITVTLSGPARGGRDARLFVRPKKAKLESSTLKSAPLARCIADHLIQLELPASAKAFRLRLTLTVTADPELRPWYGHGQVTVPGAVAPAAADAAAKAHLAAALRQYAAAAKLDPDQALLHLGQGWCLEQSGERAKAIAAYRRAHDLAWTVEGKKDSVGLGAVPIAGEAARYLIPLLDATKDAAEVTKLRERMKHLESLPRPITPIVVPLGSRQALADLVDADAGVIFDLDGTGERRAWGWPTPAAGWLVYDHLGDGRIVSGLQMMGSAAFFAFFRNGYEALLALDDDGDGVLRGTELRGLAIWRDANRNGISESGEVLPVGRWGIVAIRTRWTTGPGGVPMCVRGVGLKDGSSRPTYDWLPIGVPVRD